MADAPAGDEVVGLRRGGSRWAGFARLAGTLTFIAVLLAFVDLSELWTHLSRLSAGAVIAAVALHLIIILLLSWRWLSIVRALGQVARLGWATRLTFMTTFLNLVLPLSVGGDIGRIWLGRKGGLDLGTGVTVALLDRVIGLLALGCLTLVSAILLSSSLPTDVRWLLAMILPAILLALWPIPRAARMVAHRWPLLDRLSEMEQKARLLSHRPRPLLLVVGQSLIAHGTAVLCAFVIAQGLHVTLSLADAFLLFPVVLLATMLPFSIGGWGLREAAAISVFALVGVPAAAALSLSLIFGLTQLVASGAGALALLGWPGKSRSGAPT